MRRTLRSRLTLAATLVMFALTAALITRNEQFVFQNEGRLVVKPDAGDPDAVVFIWRSDVETPMARRFAEGFDEWKGETRRIIIDLNSPGGSIHEGEEVIRAIERMKKTHIVDTRVRARRACYSMCVPIFLQGEQRTAAASSKWMFHEPIAVDAISGKEVRQPAFERRYAARKFFTRYFANSDMDPAWREKLLQDMKGKEIWKTGRALVDEGSGIVTALE